MSLSSFIITCLIYLQLQPQNTHASCGYAYQDGIIGPNGDITVSSVYAEGYCNSIDMATFSRSFIFHCLEVRFANDDEDGELTAAIGGLIPITGNLTPATNGTDFYKGFLLEYDNANCSGLATNFTQLNDDAIYCDNSTNSTDISDESDDCNIYKYDSTVWEAQASCEGDITGTLEFYFADTGSDGICFENVSGLIGTNDFKVTTSDESVIVATYQTGVQNCDGTVWAYSNTEDGCHNISLAGNIIYSQLNSFTLIAGSGSDDSGDMSGDTTDDTDGAWRIMNDKLISVFVVIGVIVCVV